MIAPFLILTVGNESRGDDGLGPLLARRMALLLEESMIGEVELVEEFQLQIENTLDLTGRKLVLFIDAGRDTLAPFSFYQAVAQRLDGHTTHAVAPETLLGIYGMVEGEDPPPMFILCVAGSSFELGQPLSKQAAGNLEQAFDFACGLFSNPEQKTWRSLAQVATHA